MKILIVGELSERQHKMLQERWAHMPEAELIFVKHEEFYQEPETVSEPQNVWIDEVSEFREIKLDVWNDLLTPAPAADEPQGAPKTGWKALRGEKTAPVWTRRKKR